MADGRHGAQIYRVLPLADKTIANWRGWLGRSGGWLLVVGLSLSALSARAAAGPDFTREVRPILEKRCGTCHGRLQQKGKLRLDAASLVRQGGKHGPAVEPGQPSVSRLLVRVLSTDNEERMPPEGAPLEAGQIAILRAWIEGGAVVPEKEVVAPAPAEHWSFQPIRRPAAPPVRAASWPRNPVDAFILARLEARGLPPAAEAAPASLLRRIYLDLTGLPPAIAEQDAFAAEAATNAPAALDVVIDRLLARTAYGERWARHWLDLVRYADSNGYERDAAKPLVWQYRDYVIRSLNADKPYPRFVQEQLAGDELPDASRETVIATGFHRLGHWDDEPADVDADRFDQLDDLVRTTSEAFLGLTLGCARCHDHKFEPLSTRDYYALTAVFAPLRRPQDGRTERTLPAGSPAELAALAARDRELTRLEDEARAVRAKFRDEYIQDDRCPLPAESLKAWRTPPPQRSEAQKKQVAESTKSLDEAAERAWLEPVRQRLAELEQGKQAQRTAVPDLLHGYFLQEPPGAPIPATQVLVRGNPHRPGDTVVAAVPAILDAKPLVKPDDITRTSGRRLAFARWLTAPENPLLARVIVNRVWQQHFGTGLVRTPGDFGLMGEPPTHPELLDWLAHWFIHDAGGSLKKLHRLLLTSRTWRMARQPAVDVSTVDPENRLWSHVPYRRLEVEAIRDSMLAVSGQLNPQPFGPPMFPDIPSQALEANTDKASIWTASSEAEQSRRTIYAFIKRGLVVPMLEVLDLCDTVQSAPRRQITTVAPQALTLFNGTFVNTQARHLAARLRREAGVDVIARIDLAYRLALGRRPRPAEVSALQEFLNRERASRSAEPTVAGASSPDEQAWVQVARVVLNLNELVYPD